MPENFPPKGEGRRIYISSFSVSYLPADAMVQVVRQSLREGGGDYALITSINPTGFDADVMLDEMLKNAEDKPEEERARLAGVIAMTQRGAEGRAFMKTFTEALKFYAPLRTPSEMEFYLGQAGRIDKKVVFGAGTGGTVGFTVKPN
jgi:hypothetical protein